ncbi:MAG: choice-of-anchor A family protein, partial [Maritimibacter sp.]
MMKSISVSVSAFALVAFLGGSAQAATLSAEELLSQFNLITVGDVTGTSGSHVHGRALVGGNWSGGSEVYTHGDGAPSGYAALTVGGNVTSPVKVLGGG